MVLLEPTIEEPPKPDLKPEEDILKPGYEEPEKKEEPAEELLKPSYEEPKEDLKPEEDILRPGPTIHANYNWIDIVSAVGYVRLYGFKSNVSGSLAYNLITKTLNSGEYIESFDGDSDFLKTQVSNTDEINFDTSTFNLPRVIHGTPIISIPVALLHEWLSQIF